EQRINSDTAKIRFASKSGAPPRLNEGSVLLGGSFHRPPRGTAGSHRVGTGKQTNQILCELDSNVDFKTFNGRIRKGFKG
ncbi:hypothetical protein LI254_15115, partial [Dorea formicigenerans]|uniref:hypothetical protein n=1 Tax=Dorea formicigenerans TaxID=39486 RepID=UPI001D062380